MEASTDVDFTLADKQAFGDSMSSVWTTDTVMGMIILSN